MRELAIDTGICQESSQAQAKAQTTARQPEMSMCNVAAHTQMGVHF